MTDLLSLDDACKAIGLPAADTTQDADLLATYIPAVTPLVEDLTGPIVAGTGLSWSVDGGRTFILLPSAVSAVTAVTESGVALVSNVDYTVNLPAGIVVRGSVQQPYIFLPGQGNIVVTYNTGLATIPANVRLAARIILRQLWQADQQGYRPNFGAPDNDTVSTPSGFAVPKRAWELLQTGNRNVPGFA